MKFALINNSRSEAFKGEQGICPSCGSELVAKCGEVKVHHWAHKGSRNCDKWWENETEWHRTWKGHFPVEWQEVVQFDEKGEKHIADVKTDEEWVVEFQHSYLKPEERRSRNEFYKKLVWVVDGSRRKRDKMQFYEVINSPYYQDKNLEIYRVGYIYKSKLLEEWIGSRMPVLFDFNSSTESNGSTLWLLIPRFSKDHVYLMPVSRDSFIQYLSNKTFDKLRYEIIPTIQNNISRLERNKSNRMINSMQKRFISRKSRRF